MTATARDPAEGPRFTWVRYFTWLYWAGAAGLAPWIVYLFLTQAKRAQAHQVHILTFGLVMAMILGLLVTAWLYARDSRLSVMAASFTGTVTFISAWFRVLTQPKASAWAGSISVFEVVVAVIIVLCVVAIRARSRIRWLPVALALAALALAPSLVIVLVVVPGVQVAKHLRLAWTGLDVFELIAMARTGFALNRRSVTAVIPATITGALLLCDAWINIIPSDAAARSEGVALAFLEVPVAALSFWVATRAMSFPATSASPRRRR